VCTTVFRVALKWIRRAVVLVTFGFTIKMGGRAVTGRSGVSGSRMRLWNIGLRTLGFHFHCRARLGNASDRFLHYLALVAMRECYNDTAIVRENALSKTKP